jgi:type I restriction enzyme, S subunit
MFKPNHDIAKLTDIAIVIMGQSPASADCNETSIGLPLLNGPTEFGPHHPTPVQFTTDAKRIAEKGDLLFCVRGSTTGRMNWADRRYAIGRGLASIRSKDGPQSSPFVRAVIEYKLDEMLTAATGSTFPNVSREQLGGIQFPLPPLAEQRRIAKILGDLDDKIELNRTMNETLEQMARALFKSWFVDFDPVRAKMEGRTPTGMDAATAALFPDRLVDSELGMIPEGWEVKALDSIATFLNGLALQKFPASGGQTLKVIKIAQLRAGNTVGADECSSKIPGDYIIEDGDVLFSWSGSLEVELWCGGSGALNQHLFKVTSSETPKWFYYQWLRHHLPEFREIAADKATTMGHIQRRHLTEALVLVPGAELITAMTNAMQPIHNQLINNNIQSRTLSTLRDTLLQKLVSGEVRVGGAIKI